MMAKIKKIKIFIGVAWPYANGNLHLGHVAGSLLPPDIFARYHRMIGNEVLMVSGSDEHGTPITIAAEQEGIIPRELADRYHRGHLNDLKNLGIKFDIFTRTTTDNHRRVVQEMFSKLFKKGYIYKKKMKELYCPHCKRFLPDRYVEGICPFCGEKTRGDQCESCGKNLDSGLKEARCKICGSEPEIRETEHFFLKLGAFEGKLLKWLSGKKWKANVMKFTRNWLKEGLKDRAITRDLKWGIPIPIEGFEDKCIYVWFDAVTGYLSASKEWAMKEKEKNKWKEWWMGQAEHYYFLAKDNIPFHAMIWPAMLMGYGGLNLPTNIPANEYLTLSGEQFSKSRGIGIWVKDILKNFDADAVRYYLIMNLPENRDADWKWEDFVAKNNNELVGTYGNFIHRVLSFSYNKFGRIPEGEEDEMNEMDGTMKKIEEVVKKTGECIQKCRFKEGMKEIISLAQYGNKYFNENEPWKLIKRERDREKCSVVLHNSCRLVKALAILTSPFLPFSAQKIWSMLGYSDSVHEQKWDESLKDIEARNIEKPEPLFEKIDLDDIIGEEIEDPFSKLDLRIAKVTGVREHPNADKLYIMKVKIDGEREIVAGIKPFYKKDELLNKNMVVVANLEPSTIRGVESRGMLLAAENKNGVSILLADGNPGDPVFIDGIKRKPAGTLEFEEFKKVKMEAMKGKILYNDKPIKTEKGTVRVDKKVEDGAVIS